MNGEGLGRCSTNGKGYSNAFNIPCDAEGNSVLTGDGKGAYQSKKSFTCTEVEVYSVSV